ncbi:MAG: hypothetical protein ACJ79R_13535 [Anaeromyxobacteraceae bacterium]
MIGALAATLALALGATGGAGASPAQRAAAAVEHADHVRRVAAYLDRRLDVATADRDAALLSCLDEKAARVRALSRTADGAALALRATPAPPDDAAVAEAVKALLARRRADAVRADAERCLGRLAWQTGAKTRVTVTRSGDAPHAEPSPKGGAGAAGKPR